MLMRCLCTLESGDWTSVVASLIDYVCSLSLTLCHALCSLHLWICAHTLSDVTVARVTGGSEPRP